MSERERERRGGGKENKKREKTWGLAYATRALVNTAHPAMFSDTCLLSICGYCAHIWLTTCGELDSSTRQRVSRARVGTRADTRRVSSRYTIEANRRSIDDNKRRTYARFDMM